ncbi:hypothetical protein JCM8547_004197 [Rhodosporidiobolus lusitaniae]
MPALPPRPPTSSFTVATSTSPRSAADNLADSSSFSASAVSRALSHAGPSSLAQKLFWVEALTAPSTPLSTLKEAARYLDKPSYDDLLEERHMEGLCPYAACGEAAATPYKSEEEREEEKGRFRVKMRANGLFDASVEGEGREEKGAYCSMRCKRRSEWYRGLLGRDGAGEMLEDVEERREKVRRTTEEVLLEKATGREAFTSFSPPLEAAPTAAASSSFSAKPPPPSSAAFASDLLSTLSIHEKPTPSTLPSAPTPESAAHDFERPAPSTSSTFSSSSRFPSSAAPRPGASSATPPPSPGSALLPFSTASLTRTLLRSTSSQPAPPSRQPSRGLNGLPPIRFLTEPRMLDERGREVEWVGVDEEGETEEVKRWMEEALEVKRRVERGEL